MLLFERPHDLAYQRLVSFLHKTVQVNPRGQRASEIKLRG